VQLGGFGLWLTRGAFYGHRNRGKNNLFFGGKKQDADDKGVDTWLTGAPCLRWP
jgi:hypothetical protein